MIHEEDPRFKHLERKIGIFVVVALIGIIFSALLYGMQKDFFTHKYSLKFTVDRGTGFNKGMSVKLSGFRIGRVTSITLNELAMVDITMEIDKKYQQWIRDDSTVKLVKEGLVGDNIVEVAVGSLDKPELKDNESILYVRTKALDELADEIAEKVKPVLIEVRDIIGYINDPDGDLKKSIRNLETLSRNLENTRANVDSLILSSQNDVNRISTKTIQLLDTTDSTLKRINFEPTILHINSTLANIDTKLPGILDKIDDTLKNITAISDNTKVMTNVTFPKIPGLFSQSEDLLMRTDTLIQSIQNSWLLRNNIQRRIEAPYLRGDSYE